MDRHQRGIALLVVLWTLAMIAVAVAAFTGSSRTEMRLARNEVENAEARALADAGIARATYGVLEPALADRWRPDGFVYTFPFADGTVAISIQDEAGKIDLNKAPEAVLTAFFRGIGLGAAGDVLAQEIARWRAPRTAVEPEAAAGSDNPEGEAEPAAEGGFTTIDQLRQLPGVDAALFERLRPDVTVFSGRAAANPMTAPPEVLASIPGMTAGDAQAILAARAEPLDEAQLLEALQALGANRYGALTPARHLSLRAEAHTAANAVFVREALLFLPRHRLPPFELRAWTQGRRD